MFILNKLCFVSDLLSIKQFSDNRQGVIQDYVIHNTFIGYWLCLY